MAKMIKSIRRLLAGLLSIGVILCLVIMHLLDPDVSAMMISSIRQAFSPGPCAQGHRGPFIHMQKGILYCVACKTDIKTGVTSG